MSFDMLTCTFLSCPVHILPLNKLLLIRRSLGPLLLLLLLNVSQIHGMHITWHCEREL